MTLTWISRGNDTFLLRGPFSVTSVAVPREVDSFNSYCATTLGIPARDAELELTGFRFSHDEQVSAAYGICYWFDHGPGAPVTLRSALDTLHEGHVLVQEGETLVLAPAIPADMPAWLLSPHPFVGLSRVVAPGVLWHRPVEGVSLVYAATAFQFIDHRYLGLHRMDEPLRHDHGILVRFSK